MQRGLAELKTKNKLYSHPDCLLVESSAHTKFQKGRGSRQFAHSLALNMLETVPTFHTVLVNVFRDDV